MRLQICMDNLAAWRCVALQDSEKHVSDGVIESYQYLSRGVNCIVGLRLYCVPALLGTGAK